MRETSVHFVTRLTGWQLSKGAQRLRSPDGLTLPLNAAEQCLLARLMATPNELVAYAELIELTRKCADLDRTRLRLLVNRLRQKTVIRFGSALPLRVVRERGYRYETLRRRG